MVKQFGLDITYEMKKITEYTQFLDLQYEVVNKKSIERNLMLTDIWNFQATTLDILLGVLCIPRGLQTL